MPTPLGTTLYAHMPAPRQAVSGSESGPFPSAPRVTRVTHRPTRAGDEGRGVHGPAATPSAVPWEGRWKPHGGDTGPLRETDQHMRTRTNTPLWPGIWGPNGTRRVARVETCSKSLLGGESRGSNERLGEQPGCLTCPPLHAWDFFGGNVLHQSSVTWGASVESTGLLDVWGDPGICNLEASSPQSYLSQVTHV